MSRLLGTEIMDILEISLDITWGDTNFYIHMQQVFVEFNLFFWSILCDTARTFRIYSKRLNTYAQYVIKILVQTTSSKKTLETFQLFSISPVHNTIQQH
jgi:hypothetical protein